jgi:radical SAM protein
VSGKPDLATLDFARNPYIVIWEMTRACDLACVHCRAQAIPDRSPDELTTEQARRMLTDVRAFGRPVVVLTGGDPLKRPDTFELIAHGARLGLRMTMTPSGTPLMNTAALVKAKESGLSRLAVSLDGATAAVHDAFRRVHGSFDWSVKMLTEARRIGLSTQVNSTITKATIGDFDAMAELVGELGVSLWSVFFLVPTGRGRPEDEVTAEDYERVFEKMYALSKTAPFDIKSTAAPHYRRYVVQQEKGQKQKMVGPGWNAQDGVGRAARGVNDALGFVFVSHTGEICPSGFLPLSAGNVKRDTLVDAYRKSALFTQLRDVDSVKGKCGMCEYRRVCGGSRARAYAMSGDAMESEPFCSYVPATYAKLVREGKAETPEEYFRKRFAPVPVELLQVR